MAISTMYGINGVGKDTVGLELRDRHPDLALTSESRVLMYLLGITDGYSDIRPSREQYRALEDTPQDRMRELEETHYREFVGNLAADKVDALMISHLVFALYLDKDVTYLTDREIPEWYIKHGSAFLQLVAPSDLVLARRQGDAAARDRQLAGIEEINHHQALCDTRWERVVDLSGPDVPSVTIVNVDLATATLQAEEAIYGGR